MHSKTVSGRLSAVVTLLPASFLCFGAVMTRYVMSMDDLMKLAATLFVTLCVYYFTVFVLVDYFAELAICKDSVFIIKTKKPLAKKYVTLIFLLEPLFLFISYFITKPVLYVYAPLGLLFFLWHLIRVTTRIMYNDR